MAGLYIDKITLCLNDTFKEFLLKEKEYRTMKKLEDITFDDFVARLRQHYGYFTDDEIETLEILNPDTEEYMTAHEFYEYLRDEGLKATWDTGENDNA